jgi:hypothetical protein
VSNHPTVNRILLAIVGAAGLVTAISLSGAAARAAGETRAVQAEFAAVLSLDVSLPSAGAVDDITPALGASTPDTGRLDARVWTTNSTGAQLDCAMTAGDVYGGDLAGASDDTRRIERLVGDGASIGANHWGARWFDISAVVDEFYDINSTDVSSADTALAGAAGYWWAVPDFGSPRQLFNSGNFGTAGTRTARFVVGVRVGGNFPADTYSNELVFTASQNAGI